MDALLELLKTKADAANAFGALASAAAAVFALVVSVISAVVALWAVRSQRKHNELSVRPLAEVAVADYENSLWIKLKNNGIGPMVINAVTVSNGTDAKATVLEWMPTLPKQRAWTTFSHSLRDRSLSAGGELVILELTEYESEIHFGKCRDAVRKALAPLTVKVEYANVYGTIMPPHVKELSWFGRHDAI